MSFMNDLQEEILEVENESVTENGAIGYKTTGKKLLDLNFMATSLRNMSEQEVYEHFKEAYFENNKLALKWLFFLRDARGGLGERKSFRLILSNLINEMSVNIEALIECICEYGRCDDIFCLLDSRYKEYITKYIDNALTRDVLNMIANKPISLLAKWMPSINTSSKDTVTLAKYFCKSFGLSEKSYRKTLSSLRKYLNVVEKDMSANNWSNIDYEAVPSKANLLYKNAFLNHDYNRRTEYLNKLNNNEVKINSSVLFPHEILHNYCNRSWYNYTLNEYDATLEAMWKALPNFNLDNTIVVSDGSGSMCVNVDKSSSVTAYEISNALAIYCSEHLSGEFKNKYITFGSKPVLVNFSDTMSLKDKIKIAFKNNDCSNTDIERVFNLILRTAVDNHTSKEDMPKNILILSDMEFDNCTDVNQKLFVKIEQDFKKYGYELPKLIFWNLASRTNVIPIRTNKNGVILVSGYSLNVMKMVLSGKTDAYECLVEILQSPRYSLVDSI